jgi:Ecdysteroid kinase-like family
MSDLPHPIPPNATALSAKWLTESLRRSGTLSAANVARLSWTPVDKPGATATVVRVALEYDRDEAGAPTTLVAKFASPYDPIRTVIHMFGLYRNEVQFYRQLGDDPGIPVPRCYYADLDVASGYFVLLLEDLTDARVGDPLNLSVGDVELAIQHLAPFHAKWWLSDRLRTLSFIRQPGSPELVAYVAQLRGTLERALGATRQRFGAQFPEILGAVTDGILARWEPFLASRSRPLTLVHRDFHPQQIFFPTEAGGRFAVFDWQTVSLGRGVDDLARILVMGLTRDDRRQHEPRLVERYHTGLEAHGVADYALDECWKHYRVGITSSVMTNIVAAANIDFALFEAEAAKAGVTLDDLLEVLFGRLAAVLEEHDVLSVIRAIA